MKCYIELVKEKENLNKILQIENNKSDKTSFEYKYILKWLKSIAIFANFVHTKWKLIEGAFLTNL